MRALLALSVICALGAALAGCAAGGGPADAGTAHDADGLSDGGGDAGRPDGAGDDGSEPGALDDLTSSWMLFVDDGWIADVSGLERSYHAFERHPANPVLRADQPWEGSKVYIYGTVLPREHAAGFRMWYKCLPTLAGDVKTRTLYAESDDGIAWTKPALGVRSFEGSTENNICFDRPGASDITSVLHTPWEPEPGRRYTFVNWENDQPTGYYAGWSADGLRVTDAPGNPVLAAGGDVGQFFFDPHTRLYLGFVKVPNDVAGTRRRSVAICSALDVSAWSDPQLVLAPDSYDDRWAAPQQRTHFYGLSAFAYATQYLGLLWIFRATDDEGYYVGPTFVELISAHSPTQWIREQEPRPPILDRGAPGAWDAGQVYTATHPIQVGDELWLYYGGCDTEHGTPLDAMRCAVGLATLRRDGFASLDASAAAGSVTTVALRGAAGALRVNYRAGPGGALAVELQDGAGAAIAGHGLADCDPLTGDSVDATVTWHGDARLPPADRLSIRFVLNDASLYAFSAGPSAQTAP
ncbi:MAG: hypothetical protein JXR96_17555 [Deltaproteobacteria bacterium]|nr:hypothetical protein [Deltaproteobacteria bacterium]